MNQSVKTDLVQFVKHLVSAFKPIAKAEDVKLSFVSSEPVIWATLPAAILAGDLAIVLTKLIEVIPEQETIRIGY